MMIKCFQGERSAHHPWKSANSGTREVLIVMKNDDHDNKYDEE